MTYTLDFSLALGSSKTSLTLAAQIVDTTGGDVGSEVTSGFTEIGNGFYLWHYTSIPDDHRGGVKFYEDGTPATILAFVSINPEEAEYTSESGLVDAIYDEALSGHTTSGTGGAALNRLGTGIISATSIVAADNTVTTYEGDDYNNSDGRALDWTEESGSIWPSDLTGATITVSIADYGTTFTGSVVTATGDSQKVRLELTSAQTSLIPAGAKTYMVRAVCTDEDEATLARGTWKHYAAV